MSKKRTLSCFVCQELLYEYSVEALDEKRQQGVKLHIADCEKCKKVLEEVKAGKAFLVKLSKSPISENFLNVISEEPKLVQVDFKKFQFSKLPKAARYSTVLVLVLLLSALGYKVFEKQKSILPLQHDGNDLMMGEMKTGGLEESEFASGAGVTEVDEVVETSGDEEGEMGGHISNKLPAATLYKPESTPSKDLKGFVYRAYFFHPDVRKITPEVVTKIEAFGGKKAGEVPLGWQRGNGSYFHFTMPEENESALRKYLNDFGELKIDRDPHERIMPQGELRVILWIEEKQNNETKTHSPPKPAEEAPNEAAK